MLGKLYVILLFATLTYAKSYYTIQLISVEKRNSIPDELLSILEKSDISYKIIKKDSSFKLTSGRYLTKKEANSALSKLKKLKSDAFITTQAIELKPKNDDFIETKTVQIMAVTDRESITNSSLRIVKSSGYKYRIIQKNGHYYLLVGEFNSKKNLSLALKRLKKSFGEDIFARSAIVNPNIKYSKNISSNHTNSKPMLKTFYAGVAFGGMSSSTKENLRKNNSLGAGFHLGLKLPYKFRIQSQYLFYPKVKEIRNNSDFTRSKATRTYHQLNISLKRKLQITSELSFYPKAGLSISRYDVDDKDLNYIKFQNSYDTSNQSELLFNPHAGFGFDYLLNKNFHFGVEYLHTFELDIDQVLLNLNYEY